MPSITSQKYPSNMPPTEEHLHQSMIINNFCNCNNANPSDHLKIIKKSTANLQSAISNFNQETSKVRISTNKPHRLWKCLLKNLLPSKTQYRKNLEKDKKSTSSNHTPQEPISCIDHRYEIIRYNHHHKPEPTKHPRFNHHINPSPFFCSNPPC